MTTATFGPPGLPPTAQPGLIRSLALAVLAHGLLVAALTFGLNWKLRTPDHVVSAELWSAVPQVAAPVEPAPAPAPPVERPRVEPPPPAPAPPAVTARDAQIAIEKARREQQAAAERDAEAQRQRKLKEERLREEKLREAKAREEAARKAKDDKAREDKLRADRAKDEQRRKEQAEEARLAQLREANLARMRGQAGATGNPNAAGTAARDAAPSASYGGRIKARIKPNIVLTAEVSGNPITEVEVRCAPDGTIIGRRLTKASGSAAWDDAVLRAIDKTEVLPRDVDGRVPGTLLLVFSPRE